ncbi:hypothetical protein [Leptolyngbya sp. PCC 6406]|uniref:hypothetical protein n=1 Tax=Leptolyngbya sp. PCC 6406 TaxID=1173264 RepID=UPI0002AC4F69|nr:hypothetical protein [Leptolyngbya sp. PCC 6406]
MTISTRPRTLTDELNIVHNAGLTMNDMFLAEAALVARELLLKLTEKHHCSLGDITAEDLVTELQHRAPSTYMTPAIPPASGLTA